MNAPLSLFLMQFPATPAPARSPRPAPPIPDEDFDDSEDVPDAKPGAWLTITELEAQLEHAAQSARSEAEQKHEAQIAALNAAHYEAIAQALDAARAEWAVSESALFSSGLESSLAELRIMLADRVASVLRPLLATALLARTKTELLEALDRLLADPSQPILSVRAPEDLGAALRNARPSVGIEWIVADTVEVAIVANGTRIETKLAAALADIVLTEI